MLGGLGLTLGDLLRTTARADLKHYDSKEGKAKSIIHITLGGGMAAQESWDPKPEAPLEYRDPLGVAKTCLPGVAFSENLSHTARVADKMTVIRSMTGRKADHGRATYTMFTGYRMSPALKHPSAGSIISHEFGSRNGLPAYIGVPNVHPDAGTGYLSAKYAGFGIGGDPGKGDFKVRDLTLMPHVDESRFTRRRDLRLAVEDHFRSLDTKSDALGAMDEFYQQACTLISSASARDAFDLSREPAKLAETYGKNEAGGRLLLARRLVESGVRMVNVSYSGWDHHAGIADNIRKQLPPLDQALAALITDLDQRGLLDSTIVMVTSQQIPDRPQWHPGHCGNPDRRQHCERDAQRHGCGHLPLRGQKRPAILRRTLSHPAPQRAPRGRFPGRSVNHRCYRQAPRFCQRSSACPHRSLPQPDRSRRGPGFVSVRPVLPPDNTSRPTPEPPLFPPARCSSPVPSATVPSMSELWAPSAAAVRSSWA